jgi:hypothetical protein
MKMETEAYISWYYLNAVLKQIGRMRTGISWLKTASIGDDS